MNQKKESWVITYLFGVLLALVLLIGVFLRIIEIRGWKKFPHGKGGVLLAPNHPSLLEPHLMIALFFVGYLSHPARLGPYTLADADNYTKNRVWSIFNKRIFPVVRLEGDPSDEERRRAATINEESKDKAISTLRNGGSVIIFAEGTRTGSDKVARKGYIEDDLGHRIRPFLPIISILARESGATIVPVWNEISWSKRHKKIFGRERWWPKEIRISIGDPMKFGKGDKINHITRTIQSAVLAEAKTN